MLSRIIGRKNFLTPQAQVLIISIFDLLFIIYISIQYFFTLFTSSGINSINTFINIIILVIFSVLLLLEYIRYHEFFNIQTKLGLILWISTSIWYWGFGIFYYFGTVNLNSIQMKLAFFSFLWEVPLVGMVFILISLYRFNGIYSALKSNVNGVNIESLFKKLLNYPAYIATLLFLFSVCGYIIGAFQLKLFTGLPDIEFWKNVGNGIVISMFLSFFVYVIFDSTLGEIRGEVKAILKLKKSHTRRLSRRVLALVCMISLATVGVICLFVLQLTQVLLGQSAYSEIKNEISIASQAKVASQVYLILKVSKNTHILPFNQVTLNGQSFAVSTISSINQTSDGIFVDNNITQKIITVGYYPAVQTKLMTVTPLYDFYTPLLVVPLTIIPLGAFLVIFTIVIGIFFTTSLSNKIKFLTFNINKALYEEDIPGLDINTDDELEELAEAFSEFIKKLQIAVRAARIERSYVESERTKLNTLIQTLPIGVEVLDAFTGRVSLINKAVFEILNINSNDNVQANIIRENYLMVKDDNSVYPGSDHPINVALRENKEVTIANLFQNKKNGTKIALKITCIPVQDEDGVTNFLLVLIQDIDKEYRLDKEKTNFVYFTTHELRTPIAAIKGILSMLLSGDYGNLSIDVKKALEDMSLSSNTLLQIVNEYLSLSRIEGGALKVEYSEFTLTDLIDELVTQFTPIMDQKGITFVANKSVDLKINSDRNKIKEILVNLLGNALKFTSKGYIKIDYELVKDKVKILVSDSGIGISNSDKNTLFKKFGKIEKNDFDRSPGTGLGLYISLVLAQKLGGNIYLANSTEGEGSTFALEVPIYPSVASHN